uniref:Uncharacterized protein n=1 Tax=Arundo donax TaxID=35708 RepID=A0A0A9HRR2_ARUDO
MFRVTGFLVLYPLIFAHLSFFYMLYIYCSRVLGCCMHTTFAFPVARPLHIW